MISSSPVQDTASTPHFQLERLRKELAREGDARDELEKELANQISNISEKGTSDTPTRHLFSCYVWSLTNVCFDVSNLCKQYFTHP